MPDRRLRVQAVVVAGLSWGDEGKGSCCDYLTRYFPSQLTVRYNGGPQCAHNVVTDEGLHHTFAQFGSGTLTGAATHLSRFMLIDPMRLLREAQVLDEKIGGDPLANVSVDPRAVIITPFHRQANQLRETLRDKNRHGSVGLGVGEARGDELRGMALRIGDLPSEWHTERLLNEIEADKRAEFGEAWVPTYRIPALVRYYSEFAREITMRSSEEVLREQTAPVIFEGAQGVLLDEKYGTAPYNTWTNCTFDNANTLLQEAGYTGIVRLGVLRSYGTRHGPGPFPTEYPAGPERERLLAREMHNHLHPWMGPFRVGGFDWDMAHYALGACRRWNPYFNHTDGLCITHLDALENPDRFLSEVEDRTGIPVLIESRGPRPHDKRVRSYSAEQKLYNISELAKV